VERKFCSVNFLFFSKLSFRENLVSRRRRVIEELMLGGFSSLLNSSCDQLLSGERARFLVLVNRNELEG